MTFAGSLASIDIIACTNTLLYANTKSLWYKVIVNITNRNKKEDAKIRLALVKGDEASDLTNAQWLEYDTIIRANGVLERSEISLPGEYCLVGYASKSNVSFSVYG